MVGKREEPESDVRFQIAGQGVVFDVLAERMPRGETGFLTASECQRLVRWLNGPCSPLLAVMPVIEAKVREMRERR